MTTSVITQDRPRGWRIEKHVRLVANITNNQDKDIVGFGEDGVLVSTNNGNSTFTQPPRLVKDFAYNAGGWRVEKHIRYLADIRGIGRCDIVGFGDGGVVVSRNGGNATFNPVYIAINDFGYNAGGWRLNRHLRFLGDATGNCLPDIIGFGENNVFVARNNGNGTFAPAQAVINNFCYSAGGWRVDQHPRFIADLTGDKKVDLIGCGGAGVYVSLNDGNGKFGAVNLVVNNFGTAQGWKGDIVGFGEAGVYVSFNNRNGTFQPAKLVINDFGVKQEWKVDKHPRYVVDLTGDGRVDVIGFGEENVYVAYNIGNGTFSPVKALLPKFSFKDGWTVEKTMRYLANLDQSK